MGGCVCGAHHGILRGPRVAVAEALLLSQLHHLVEDHLLGHAELHAALLDIDGAGYLVGDDGYGAHHLAHQVGTPDGIALRLIKEEPCLEPYEVGLVLFEVSFELLLGGLFWSRSRGLRPRGA